jgi:hypothetical protein
MEVKLRWVRVKDPRRVEWWNSRWDLAGEIDPEVTSRLELDAVVDGRLMGREWTAKAVERAEACGCQECAECMVASQIEARHRLLVA